MIDFFDILEQDADKTVEKNLLPLQSVEELDFYLNVDKSLGQFVYKPTTSVVAGKSHIIKGYRDYI